MRVDRIAALLAALVFTAGCAPSARQTPVVRVVRENAVSVVNIGTEQIVPIGGNPFWGNYGSFFDRYFTDASRAGGVALKTQSLGSGVVVDGGDALVVTNAHVVQMASRVFVTLSDGRTFEADVIGTTQNDDLALIRVRTEKKLRPVPLARDAIIGETVVVIGNPLGLQNSVTTGVVSGTHRNLPAPVTHVFTDLLQTDASINPGSSGGALLNLDGELLGINLAVVEHAQNIGFAVPVSKVRAMLDEYRRVKPSLVRKSSA